MFLGSMSLFEVVAAVAALEGHSDCQVDAGAGCFAPSACIGHSGGISEVEGADFMFEAMLVQALAALAFRSLTSFLLMSVSLMLALLCIGHSAGISAACSECPAPISTWKCSQISQYHVVS